MMSLFNQNSYFVGDDLPRQSIQDRQEPVADGITSKHLEDWAYRLQSAADEAGDGRLLALESDLLDLRDEITYALHQLLL